MYQVRAFSMLVVYGFAAAVSMTGSAQDRPVRKMDESVRNIFTSLRARQESIPSVRYTLEGKQLTPKDYIESGVPADDRISTFSVTLSFEFEKNCLRKEYSREAFNLDTKEFYRAREMYLFNGTQLQHYRPRDENADQFQGEFKYNTNLTLLKDTDAMFVLEPGDYAVLMAEGILQRPQLGWNSTRTIRVPLDPTLYRVQGSGQLDGRECVVLRSANTAAGSRRYHDIWVDTEQGSSIVRYSLYQGDSELSRIRMWYEQLGSQWNLRRYTAGRPVDDDFVVMFDMTVVSREVAPKFGEEEFQLTPTVGTVVKDVITGDRVKVTEDGERDVRELYAEDQRKSGRFRLLIWAAGTIAFVSIAIIVQHYRRKVG